MAIVTIVGRPNVGKSSLFNRIARRRTAIVDDEPGVTRDRLYIQAEWQGTKFYLVDTGGMTGSSSDGLAQAVHRQVDTAIEESDVILFVVDTKTGVTPLDEEIAQLLRKTGKPVIVVGNKIDDPSQETRLFDLYELGFENIVGVSSAHGRNMDELLDMMLPHITGMPHIEENDDEIRLAIVGRPNVGKSTLLNALAKTERVLVGDAPGTTRDSADVVVHFNKQPFRIIDTAGLRKRSKIRSSLEFYSLVRTHEAVDKSDVTVLLMQVDPLCTDQDKKIAAHVVEKGKGLVLAVNKWDTIEKSPRIGDVVRETIRREMPFVDFAPIVFVSAKSGRGLHKIPGLVSQVNENRKRRLPTDLLARIVSESFLFEHMPTDKKGRRLSIYKCTQIGTEPPHFEFIVNDTTIFNTSFERHVHHMLRNMAEFEGVPIRISWRRATKSVKKSH